LNIILYFRGSREGAERVFDVELVTLAGGRSLKARCGKVVHADIKKVNSLSKFADRPGITLPPSLIDIIMD
jgi:hypothetical protein